MTWISSEVYGGTISISKGHVISTGPTPRRPSNLPVTLARQYPATNHSPADENKQLYFIPRSGPINFYELLEQMADMVLRTLRGFMIRIPASITTCSSSNRSPKRQFLECRDACLSWNEEYFKMKSAIESGGYSSCALPCDAENTMLMNFDYIHARAADWLEILVCFDKVATATSDALNSVAGLSRELHQQFDFTLDTNFAQWEIFQDKVNHLLMDVVSTT
jgi:hypothetical protein